MKGIRIASQGKSYWVEDPDKRIHPEGAPYYWLGGTWGAAEEEPHSDVSLLEEGYISIAPIHVGELTCNQTLEKHKDFTEKSLNLEVNEFAPE